MGNLMAHKDKWMTPELMEKFARNPVLRNGLADPRCMAALEEFQRNPKEAFKKYGSVPGINEFFNAVSRWSKMGSDSSFLKNPNLFWFR